MLASLGWTPALEDQFAPHAADGLEPARVAVEHRGAYVVYTARGELPGRALRPASPCRRGAGRPARGRRLGRRHADRARHGPGRPAAADEVLANGGERPRPDDRAGRRRERRRHLPDRRARRRPERPPARAVPDARLGERRRPRRRAHEVGSLRRRGGGALEVASVAIGVPVHAVSNVTGEGTEALRPYFAEGRTVAALGSSGVGKSSLVNRLAGEELMAVGELRADGKGRHTTTNRQLLVLPGGGLFLDTPGMREIRLWDSERGPRDRVRRRHRGGGALPVQRLLARGGAGLRRPRRARCGDARRGALHQLAEASGRAAPLGDEAGQPSACGGAEGAAAVCARAAEGVVVSRR